MNRYCIAIGIDAYASPDWKLGACAADAIRFADWAVSAGGVDPSNLRLMVAPPDNTPAEVDLPGSKVRVPNVAPGRSAIMTLLLKEIDTLDWASGDRLYFYFAGHGCSHEFARGQRPEPVLFPLDVTELPLDSHMLVSFEDVLSPLRAHGPRDQLIFIDACRDFALPDYASSAGVSPGRYFRPVLDDARRAQNIIYATAPGERSIELGTGQGVFAKALLEGLNGHPAALQRLAGQADYQLTLARLAAYVRKVVDTRIRRFLIDTPFRFVQAPEFEPDPRQPEFEIATIDAARVAPQPVYVRVAPGDKIDKGWIEVFYERQRLNPDPLYGPPLKATHQLFLKPNYYDVRACTPDLSSDPVTIAIPYEGVIELKLQAQQDRPDPTSLTFATSDRTLPILVVDPENTVSSGLGSVSFVRPKVGHYRAAVLSPDRPLEYRAFAFPACGASVTLEAPPPVLTGASAAAVRDLGMTTSDAGVDPAEGLGTQAEFRLTSLLAFGAYATYSAPSGVMHRLRSIALEVIEHNAEDVSENAWITILVGATGYQPLKGQSIATFLQGVRAVVPGSSPDDSELGLRTLAKLPGTAQLLARCPLGSFSVEVSLPGIPPTRFAMNGMKGRVATLVIGVADDGALEVVQYLFKLGGGDLEEADLPLLEKALRFFVAGQPLPVAITRALLRTKLTDPLAACLAGYALIREGRRDLFRGDFSKGSTAWNPESAMQNLLSGFDGLPDAHILAGLCDPDDRDAHFRRAFSRGLPIFADGFRALIDYFGSGLGRSPSEFNRAWRTLSIGTAYSSWLSREPQLAVRDGRFDPPPVQWRVLETDRNRIERQLPACGFVTVVDDKGLIATAGTGFLVAPDLVVTADHVVAGATDAASVYFSNADACASTGHAKGGGISAVHVEAYPAGRFALLWLKEPLELGTVFPVAKEVFGKPGDLIYVPCYIGNSGNGVARKQVMPGFILDTLGETFDHDASTVGGSGGAPVVSVATGEVIGIHWGGMAWGAYKRNRANRLHLPFQGDGDQQLTNR